MPDFLILKLVGPMQAWGKHTYEDYRPTHLFPTRSGLVGLLAACLGLDREDSQAQQNLNSSLILAVRTDEREIPISIINDWHTVRGVPKATGAINPYSIITKREYLCDAQFTAALESKSDAPYSLAQIMAGVQKPFYTPSLGRRSCPFSRPLFEAMVKAESLQEALSQIAPHKGIVYSEVADQYKQRLEIRDVPTFKNGQFTKRIVYIS